MNLRKHQGETSRIVDRILAGSAVRNIVANVVPGGGKSLLPVIAGSKLIPSGLAEKIAWICPRLSLQDQGERVFVDPRFRGTLGHLLTIRSATNDHNPCRGTNGFTSTYQAVAVDARQTVLRDFERHPYILVLDEFHHLAEEGEWTKPIQELYDRARYRLLLTGTLSRGDRQKIAFVPYRAAGDDLLPSFEADAQTAVIRYSRMDALRERAIIPLEFAFFDGQAEWEKPTGQVVKARLSTTRADVGQALFTALKTEYAEELLAAGVLHWTRHRKEVNPNGSLMVIAANIETAKDYTERLRRMGLRAEIATSDDTPQAIKHINALKAGKLKILVSVAMISEGLDVPSISHIIYLTNVRTPEWIEQTVSRAVRIDPQAGPYENQKGYIFAPADRTFVEIARKIEGDQLVAIAKANAREGKQETGEMFEEGEGEGRPGITPLSSRLIASGQGDLFGYAAPAPLPFLAEPMPRTQSEIEEELLEKIDSHIKRYAFANRYSPKRLNFELYEHFGKPRRQMDVRELQECERYIMSVWPLGRARGTGIPRVPAKGQRYECEWR